MLLWLLLAKCLLSRNAQMQITKETFMKYFFAFLSSFFVFQQANAVTCKATLVSRPCGSGEAKVVFDKETLVFSLNNGGVSCWMGDFEAKGILKKTKAAYPYFLADSFELISDEKARREPKIG